MPLPARFLFAHHTVTAPKASDAAEARNVQDIAFARGFSDISYSFLVSSRANALEGRGVGIAGAHTVTKAGTRQLKQYGKKNWNSISHAVSLVGNADNNLSDAQVNTFRWLRHWLIEQGAQRPPDGPWKPWKPGVAPQHGWYAPHQEVNATGCPGALLVARLGDLNTPIASGETPAPARPPVDLSDLSDVDIEGLPDGRVGAGDYGQVVVWLQRLLAARARQYGRTGFDPGVIDGDYGPVTVAAMKAWRAAVGLDPYDGSWDSLVRAQSLLVRDSGVPLVGDGPIVVTPPAATGTPILAPTVVSAPRARAWGARRGAAPVFGDIIDALYGARNEHGVDLAGAVAQAAIETGFGRFGGAVTAEWHNPAGLKVSGASGDRPEDHHRFGSWAEGVDAQLVHLALYAGHESENGPARDPRYWLGVKGVAPTWEGLSGRWAMVDWYGARVVELRAELLATPEPEPEPEPGPEPEPATAVLAAFEALEPSYAEWLAAYRAAIADGRRLLEGREG